MDNAINKVVTEVALGQLDSLIDKVIKADEALIKASQSANTFSKSMGTPPKTSDALNKQLQESQKLIRELQADYKKQETALANLQKKYESLAQAKKAGVASDRQSIIDNREIRKELDGQAIANSNLTSYIQKLSVERQKASRIVADYNAQVAMGTALTEEQSAELAQATASFQKYDNAIKAGKKSIGDAREYVGQYERANLGLVNSVNQIVREVPSATFGIQTFFLAISNNVPIMVDEIKTAVAANKQLAKSGEATVPVWKQVAGALFSFNSILNIGLLVLALYGKEIGKFFTEITKGTQSLNDGTKALLDFQNAQTKGIENTKNELQIYREYVKIAGDKSLGYQKQKIAIDYLKTSYPGLLKSLSDEQIMKLKGSDLDKKIEATLGFRERYKANLEEIESINKKIEAYKSEINARVQYSTRLKELEKERYDTSRSGREILDTVEKINLLKQEEKIRKESVKDEIISAASTAQLQESLISLQDIYSSSLKQSQILKEKSIILEEKDTNSKDDNTRAIKLNTKAREDYLASEYELWKLRKENESDRNKDIMNDEASGYELRLMASEQYYANQLDLANRAAQEELRVLKFSYEEQQRTTENEFLNYQDSLNKKLKEDNLSASQRLLIEKELADSKKQFGDDQVAMAKDNSNKQNIIYENQAQKLIDINLETIGVMQRAWDEINFGKADIEIANVDLKGIEKLGDAFKSIGGNLSSGEIERELQKISDLSRDLALDISKREAQLQVDREENNIKRLIDEILITAQIQNLSDEQTEKLLTNNKALQDAELKLIEAKKKKEKVDNDVTNSEIDNSKKVQKAKEDEYEFILESAQRLASDLQGLTDTLFQRGVDDYDRQIEKSNEYYDSLLENAERGSEQELALQEEKERKEAELQRRKISLQRKQAVFNKFLALADIALSLQLELAKNRASGGTIAGGLLDGIAIASAAIRTATVLATPLPQYKDGRGKGKDEFAVVGDGGRSEVIERGNGKFEITPSSPTITHLGKDDIVHKSVDDFERSKLAIQNASIMASFGKQSRQLEMFDYYLGKEFRGISSKIEKGIEKGFKKVRINNNVNNKIDIDHWQYRNKGFNA